MPISPNQGVSSGGTVVTITGVNLAGALAVHFGTNTGTITANTPTSVTVIAPAGSGVVNVNVTTPGGTSNSLAFFYISPPFVVSFSSYSGPVAGGNTILIDGFSLATATSVTFGSNTATPTIINDGQISVVVPAGTAAGSVSAYVTTAGGTSAYSTYIYVDTPTVTTISPSSGSTNGGTAISITGTDLMTTTSVTIGGVTAYFVVISSTSLSVITPAGTAGAADVVVTTTGGSATAIGGYTYVASPGI